MSFASVTKNQLARHISDDRAALLAELSAIVRVCGTLKLKMGGRVDVHIATENASVARLIFTLFKKVFKKHTEVVVKRNNSLKRHNIYEIHLEHALEILTKLHIFESDDGLVINDQVPQPFLEDEATKRAYIRGVFLGSGSISDPEKSYHMEFVTHNAIFSEAFKDLLNTYDLNAKVVIRKSNYVVYIKEGDKIVDTLNIIGAHKTLFEFENTRVVKQVRNNVNRVVNCETANLNKTAYAAVRQIEAITIIKEVMGLDALPDNLREIAMIRIQQPEMSLTELGSLLTPPIGKSGINHRLKKIERMAQKITEGTSYVKHKRHY